MIKLLILLVLFSLPDLCQAQRRYNYKQGYRFIRKAYDNTSKGNLKRAERFLKKAKHSNYGFCGNAWISAFDRIYYIESLVCNERKQYDLSLRLLDSIDGCIFGANCEITDSVKMLTLMLKFGKSKVKESFDLIREITISQADSFNFEQYYLVFPGLDYKFRLPFSMYRYVVVDGKYISEKKSPSEIFKEAMELKCFDPLRN